MTQQISVTRALAELKTLTARIQQAIYSGTYVAVTRGTSKTPLGFAKNADQLKTDISASFQSVDALIKRREKIKRAVILSNAATKVVVSGVEMTVAEAIEQKASIDSKKLLLNHLQSSLQSATSTLSAQNARVDADIEKRVMAAYGNDKGKITPEQHSIIASAVKGESQAELLNPEKIEDKITALSKEISDFETEVDFVLSESNARTTITVE